MITHATVAALYIDARGPYPKMPEVDAWDVERDATKYNGPLPVVAHPACGPWGKLRHMYQGGEGGPELAIRAVEQVQLWGGVLEHPASSLLWEHCGLPRPGDPPDWCGGWTERIDQSDFGHVARKPTWIYCVRVDRELAAWRPPKREPTHWIAGRHKPPAPEQRARWNNMSSCPGVCPAHIKICSGQQRKRTPKFCAEWLVLLASSGEAFS
jgi:hypothetical protein